MSRNALIAIGVSTYARRLEALPGAVNGAVSFATWGKRQGYDRLLITDRGDDHVTVARLKQEIEAFLGKAEYDRLLVYFAGHGCARGASDQFWLLHDAMDDPTEAVHVGSFKLELQKWRFAQLGIFADACRTASQMGIGVHGSPVVKGPQPVPKTAQLDLFLATTLGDPALAVPGGQDAEAYCLFTSVVVEALAGQHEAAIRREHHPDAPAIVSSSLADFVEVETKRRAGTLDEDMTPDTQAAFRHPNDVYAQLDADLPAPEPPAGGPLPPGHDAAPAQGVTLMGAREFFEPSTERASVDRFDGTLMEDLRAVWPAGSAAARDAAGMTSGEPLFVSDARIQRCAMPPAMEAAQIVHSDAASAVGGKPKAGTEALRQPLLACLGRDAWSLVPVFERQVATKLPSFGSDLFMISKEALQDVMLDLPRPDYWTLMDINPNPVGGLRVSEAPRMADQMRHGKHQNPFLAVQAAYLYEFANDYDNITRMAHYFARAGEPVPFDVALLCASALRWEEATEGTTVYADLLAVEASDEPQNGERRPRFATIAMRAQRNARVSGLAPVLRQGWAFIDTASHVELPGMYRELSREVRGSTYTVFTEAGAATFSEVFRYQRVD